MVSTFVKSPLYSNWFEKNYPHKSLVICSPFFKNSSLEKVIDHYHLSDENRNIKFQVLIRGRLEDFVQGSSDISALESLIQLKNVEVDDIRRLTNLHMKAYLIDDDSLLIGSGNFTQSGLFTKSNYCNVEGAIESKDNMLIKEFKEYYTEIIGSAESLNTFYDVITEEYEKYIDKNSSRIGDEVVSLMAKGESKASYKFVSPKRTRVGKRKIYSADISVDLIPQYSNFEDGAYKVVDVLVKEGNRGLTFDELGTMLQGDKGDVANKKYGENHAKLAELLDFVTISHERPRKIYLTRLGEIFSKSEMNKKVNILKQQVFRMPIVKDIIIKHTDDGFSLLDYLLNLNLAPSTAQRRSPNIRTLFKFLKEENVSEMDNVVKKL